MQGILRNEVSQLVMVAAGRAITVRDYGDRSARLQRGFSLLEMLVVVVIIGILAAMAYPNYQNYVIRSARAEGFALLNDAAVRQERFFAQNNGYVTDQDDVGDLGMPSTSGTTVLSTTGFYSLTVSTVEDDGGFTLTATREGVQVRDTECGDLTLDATGQRGVSVAGADIDACWR